MNIIPVFNCAKLNLSERSSDKVSPAMHAMLRDLQRAKCWTRWPRGKIRTMEALMRRKLIQWSQTEGYTLTLGGTHEALCSPPDK